ncbi:23S rRNA (adenine(2030)-N(6))-methyltransferase RlmJ [Solimicrobium silvestre]|uniref:Ribosomal RNA large subunit methyltransferase J n=1 Tax=Solimicrobium silvestre TaxID=2099400 RepID=A0A2S9GUA5_9BURK|nr:23S rRNA (adenine(2030)-N(6))-methyltransferase RlmJ [Solimicrobium silvestre]PRC91315.1 Protein involved in catabolism of external DNA [Solimicrobium silvestre]
MLSYRHAFHAGNHADVLKHFITIQLLNYMGQKDAPFTYIDTHAGAGLYALDTGYAAKNAEYENGIAKLWEKKDLPAALVEYVDLIKELNPSGKLRYYPGSPYCAEHVMRLEDRLRLFELHPSDIKILHENMRKRELHQAEQGQKARGKRVMVMAGDGFEGLKALLPPQQRRALVLIDPPYEDKRDYKRVKDTLADSLQRFSAGTYAVWYPVLQRQESREFARKLSQLPVDSWLSVTLSISQAMPDGFGLHSSGMFIINPPWTMEAMLKEVMPYLVKTLGNDSAAKFTLESGQGAAPIGRKPVRPKTA